LIHFLDLQRFFELLKIDFKMRISKLFLAFLFSYIIGIEAFAQSSIVTVDPYIESSNTNEAHIDKIELTDKYTIVYMSFKLGRSTNSNGRSGKGNQTLQDLLDILMNGTMGSNRNTLSTYISIRPSSKLIALDGQRTFKYIKANGIPEEPNKLNVYSGEKVNFRVYYEKIDAGITVFDFFEGDNSDQVRCWNYYKVHITNPSDKVLRQKELADTTLVKPVFFIKGKVLDEKTKKPINAKLEYLLSPSMIAIDSTMTYWNSGSYKVNIMNKGVYNCVVSAPGYLIKQESIDLFTANANNTIIRDFYLTPIVKGDIVLLNNIYFETAEYELLTASFAELNKLKELMNQNPTLTILIEGHTDIIGDKKANMELSQKRVNSVKNYLISKGIDSKRIETKGWGSSKPLNANGNDDERKVNRRVEFRVMNL
jgi:outer membrane protein OmpA-like peptidoglycan-associated protein